MAAEYSVYIDGVYQGNITSQTWNISKIYTTPPTPFGSGYYLPLPFASIHTWRVDVGDDRVDGVITGDTWTFVVGAQVIPLGPFSLPILGVATMDIAVMGSVIQEVVPPYIKPVLPSNVIWQPGDPDLPWQWVPLNYDAGWLVRGGGRYQKRILAFTMDNSGLGSIWFGEV